MGLHSKREKPSPRVALRAVHIFLQFRDLRDSTRAPRANSYDTRPAGEATKLSAIFFPWAKLATNRKDVFESCGWTT